MNLSPKRLCVGCGFCAAACPHDAICMLMESSGLKRPRVNLRICAQCGICTRACPQTEERIQALASSVSSLSDPRKYGLTNSQSWLAWDESSGRSASASGGVITALARYLLGSGAVDGVVHVKRLAVGRGGPHYRIEISKTLEAVEDGRSSAYEALDFSEALRELEPGKAYLITGTPCIIRGVRGLQEHAPRFKSVRFVTCALVCSHNVTPQLADYIADRHRVPLKADFEVDFRNKDGIPSASKFNTRLGKGAVSWLKIERSKSGWTHVWRNYYFSLDACCLCPDFWGAEADISVKDAWGRKEWTADPLGKSVVVIRQSELIEALRAMGVLRVPLSQDEIAAMQPSETSFKQVHAAEKFSDGALSRAGLRNGLARKLAMARVSRYVYSLFGYQATRLAMRLLRAGFDALDKLRRVPVPTRIKRILVAGGYGYGNAGDEAQCAETLRALAERFPSHEIINLTPRPSYSASVHPGFRHEAASRVAFFNQGTPDNIYRVATWWQRVRFLSVGMLLLWNARRIRRGKSSLFLNERRVRLLRLMATSDLFFFCGGGYLTGATRTRLWDGVLVCCLCRTFGVPVVMSGQTIGEWQGWMDRSLARTGFRSVALITTRDDRASIADLNRIGVGGKHVFATHDDALFCLKGEHREMPDGECVAVNFHFWKMSTDERSFVLKRLRAVLGYVSERLQTARFVFVPMVDSDLQGYSAFRDRYPEFPLDVFDGQGDFLRIRRALADATLVLTMKHHPIIFAVGEGVPVVSMAYSSYYVHKNVGALEQYGLAECSFDLGDDRWLECLEKAFVRATDHDWYAKTLASGIQKVRIRKEQFWNLTEQLVEGGNEVS